MSKRGINDINGGENNTFHPRKCKSKHSNNTSSSSSYGDNEGRTIRKSARSPKARDFFLKETLVKSRLGKSQKGAAKLANEVIETDFDDVRGLHQPGALFIKESPEVLELRDKGYKKFNDIMEPDGWEARIKRSGLDSAWIYCRKELKLRGGKYKPQLNVNYFNSYEDIELECQKPDMSLTWVLDRAKLSLGLPLEISLLSSSEDEDEEDKANAKHSKEPASTEAATAAGTGAVGEDEDELNKKLPAVVRKPPPTPSFPRVRNRKVAAKTVSTERHQVYTSALVTPPPERSNMPTSSVARTRNGHDNRPTATRDTTTRGVARPLFSAASLKKRSTSATRSPEWSAMPLFARKSLETTTSKGVARLLTRTNLSAAAGLKKPPPSQANSSTAGLKKPPPSSQAIRGATGSKKPPPSQDRTSTSTTSRASVAGPLFQRSNAGADGMKKKKKPPPSPASISFKRVAALEEQFDIHYDPNDPRQRKPTTDRLAVLEWEVFGEARPKKDLMVRIKELEDSVF